MSESTSRADGRRLPALTSQIVAAYVAHNKTASDALPPLIQSVHRALAAAGETPTSVAEKQQPAVPVRRSVFPDHIVCLEDGKKLKLLKRHLHAAYGMTPQQYRDKWGLPPGYPMVAPKYAAHRSSLAKRIGLGRKPAKRLSISKLPARRAKASKR